MTRLIIATAIGVALVAATPVTLVRAYLHRRRLDRWAGRRPAAREWFI